MKSARSITSRHFVGGFFGGMLGILAFHFLNQVLLPFGCFIGVVVGFWYQELGDVVAKEWQKFRIPSERPILHPVEPIDIARKIETQAFVFGAIIFLIGSGWVLHTLYALRTLERGEVSVMTTVVIMVSIIGWLWVTIRRIEDEESLEDMRAYYVSLARYVNRGGAYVFVRAFALGLLAPFALPVAMLGVFGVVAVGAVPVLLIVVPVSLVFGMMRQLYKIAMGTGHWLCVGITVATTGATAYGMNGSMTSASVWLVALIAGTLSGGAAVWTHNGLKWVLDRAPRVARFMAKTFEQHWGEIEESCHHLRLWLFSPVGYQYRR